MMNNRIAAEKDVRKNTSPGQGLGDLNIWGAFQTVISVAVLVATLLTLWTPGNLFSNREVGEMVFSVQSTRQATAAPLTPQPTSPPAKTRIGIVAGHYGNDSGAMCPDGLREVDVNLQIATLVRQQLINQGYDVDLLEEFDKRLFTYQASALVSIHNDSCEYFEDATGFKVAPAADTAYPEKAERLTNCLIVRYQEHTGLKYHFNTVTKDMTSNHAFTEINANTTAAIIETGFLNLDRDLLTNHPDIVADGVVAGILCYLNNESVQIPDTVNQ